MEDVLRWSLLVLGSCIIAAVLAHGLWVSRKNSNKKSIQGKSGYRASTKQEYQPGDWRDPEVDAEDETNEDMGDLSLVDVANTDDIDLDKDPVINPLNSNFDDLGLSAVKVVTSASAEHKATSPASNIADEVDDTLAEETAEAPVESVNMYKSVVTQPKPQYAGENRPAASSSKPQSHRQFADNTATVPASTSETPLPPASLLKKQAEKNQQASPERRAELLDVPQVEKISLADQARNLVKRKKLESVEKKRKEPKFAEDQMKIDFNEEQPNAAPQSQQNSDQTSTGSKEADNKQDTAEPKQEVLVLNVKTADDQPIPGSALLPMLLTLGFKFGDQDIFHRHVNSNGKGPVLFSLANMFKPGNFDIDNLENFVTQGVSLFMILPIEGDPHQVFNMMHNAARKIADEFSGQIYDGRRTLLTKQSLQQYVEKIREFERQRAIYNK